VTVIRHDDLHNADRQLWAARWPNFSPSELACRGSGKLIIPESFLDELQKLREAIGKPMHITSGCRSLEYNDSVGGKRGSFHVCDADVLSRRQDGCLAVDVAATDGPYRGELFATAWRRGWTVGWNATRGFLHLDRRTTLGWRQTSFDY
jgi:hypothetical protein